jgi:hypothetical protein
VIHIVWRHVADRFVKPLVVLAPGGQSGRPGVCGVPCRSGRARDRDRGEGAGGSERALRRSSGHSTVAASLPPDVAQRRLPGGAGRSRRKRCPSHRRHRGSDGGGASLLRRGPAGRDSRVAPSRQSHLGYLRLPSRRGSQRGDRIGAVPGAIRDAPSGGAGSRGSLGDPGVVDGAGPRGAGRPLAPAGGERLGTHAPGASRLWESDGRGSPSLSSARRRSSVETEPPPGHGRCGEAKWIRTTVILPMTGSPLGCRGHTSSSFSNRQPSPRLSPHLCSTLTHCGDLTGQDNRI